MAKATKASKSADAPKKVKKIEIKFDPPAIRKSLLKHYDENHRHLPWRRTEHSLRGPCSDDEKFIEPKGFDFGYGVWISEVMLQQTRVSVVDDYWRRWVARWPNAGALAQATPDEVNRQWAGLGYYRRAQNLLKGGIFVTENFGGLMPATTEELLKIPGVGPLKKNSRNFRENHEMREKN